MTEPVLQVPFGSPLRPDAKLNYLRLAVAKALLAQMETPSDWRDVAVLTGTDQLIKSAHTDETFLEVVIDKLQWRDDEYDAAVRDYVYPLLGVQSVRVPGEDLIATPTRLPALEDRLNLPVWLAKHEPRLHKALYAHEAEPPTASRAAMDLDAVLAVIDSTSANLDRLQKVWDRAYPMLPNGPAGGSDNEFDDLMRTWQDLLTGLPPIEGWSITASLPSVDEIGMMYLEYAELGEPPFGVFEAKEKPQKDLDEYRYRLAKVRRRVIRDRLQELAGKVESLLPSMLNGVARDDEVVLDDPRVAEIVDAVSEIERLMGDAVARVGRWNDLHRHIHFGQGHDWHDIQEFDWPSVKADIGAAGLSEVDPLPVPRDIDLALLAASKPEGQASTALNWDVLDDSGFERLLYDLARVLPGYQNVELLMKTRAADRGRDISAERAFDDGAGGVRTERVMLQAKHWRSKSVPPEEIASGLTRITLWEPPSIHVYVVATSGHFTPDAVAWVEKHNYEGKRPRIDLWPETRLSTLLSERPYLVAEYGLRLPT